MGLKDSKLLSIKEIEGPTHSHDDFIKREVARRKVALDLVNDVIALADYIGGDIISLGLREDWAIKKEIFPELISSLYTIKQMKSSPVISGFSIPVKESVPLAERI